MARFLFLFCLICFIPFRALALGSALVFKTIDVENGLAQNTVNDLLQDSRGFIWVATQAGLQRYDGTHLVNVFDAVPSPHTSHLSARFINVIKEDQHRRIWIGTNSQGIVIFDIASGEFLPIPEALRSLSGQQASIRDISFSDNKIWIATEAGLLQGVFNDSRNNEMQLHWLGQKGDQITAMQADGRGGVYLATRGQGLLQVGGDSRERRIAPTVLPNTILSLQVHNGALWIGGERGLYFFDPDHPNSASQLSHPMLNQHPIIAVAGSPSGDLWVSVQNEGLLHYVKEKKSFTHLVTHTSDPYSLPDMWVRRLMVDSEGTLWVGSALRGLAHAYSGNDRFRLFREYSNTSDEGNRNHIRSLYEDKKNRIWLGMDGGGLKHYDPKSGQYTYHTERLLNGNHVAKSVVNFRVQSIKTKDEETFYLASNGGFFRYQPDSKKDAERFSFGELGAERIDARSLWIDADGTKWVGTTRGLFRVSRWNEIDEHYHAAKQLVHDTVLSLFRDSKGDLWIGTINGLNRLRSDGSWQTYLYQADKPGSLCGNVIRDFAESSSGDLLIGTHSGLAIIKADARDDVSFRCVNTQNGLIDQTIYAVREDALGVYWLSSNKGLMRFDPKLELVSVYDRFDGLQGLEFNGGAAFQTQEGALFFGGVRGFNRFNPESIQPSSKDVVVHVTGYQIAAEKQHFVFGESLREIEFDYEARVIAVTYAALDFIAPHRVHFKYKLAGFDQDWIASGTGNRILYSNLPAGQYELQIMASSRDGIWTDTPYTLRLKVRSPWWWSPESKLIYTLLFLVIAAIWAWAIYARTKERYLAAEAIRIHAERLKWALWGSGDALWDWNLQTGELFRSGLDRLLGIPMTDINASIDWLEKQMHSDDAPRAVSALKRHINGETEFFETEYRMRHANGSWMWILDRGRVVERDNSGAAVRMAGTMKDITDKRRQEEELRQLASYDTLTNLPNRTLFHERLRHAVAHARRNQQRVALLFLDLDRFKQINDTMGHAAGDLLLKQMANRLRACVREEDTVARLGGDEFTVMLEEVSQVESIGVVASKIVKACEAPFELVNAEVVISPSIGISVFPDDGEDATTLLKNADMAMYHAKEQGRNNFQFFVSAMNETMRRRIQLENALRKAIEREEFSLHYQPKMEISTGQITGLEALLRWRSAQLGFVPPDEFISVAEDTGLIIPIGDWVINEAVRQISEWRKSVDIPIVQIAVNLSIRQLMHGDLAQRIQCVLDAYSVEPSLLSLELTESLVMTNAAQAVGRLNALRDMGISLAVDDFGTGYSSLSYLRRLPIDIIKIDKAFVRDISLDVDDATIISTIIAMAHSLKLRVVAEGVETNEQLHFLREEGCEEMQGYWLSKPLPAKECGEMLKKHF